MLFKTGFMAILAAGSAMAHMNMNDPAPLSYKGNPNTQEANKDYSITSPITAAQYPCKNNLKLLGTPDGTPVVTYSPGQQTTMTVEGGAPHNGGSCQLSLSYDKGTTFTVIKSFHGGCPTSSGQKFDFTIPSDAPEGNDVVFAWTWVNKTGNREYYMSCAVVNIKAGGGKRAIDPNAKRASVAFADRPQVFQANLGGKYCTAEGVDTEFPDPGPDVEVASGASLGPATICATGEKAPTNGSGSGSDSGSGSGSSSAPASSSAPGSSSAPAGVSTASSSAAATPTGGVFLTTGGAAVPTTLVTATSSSVAASSSAAASSSVAATSSAAVSSPSVTSAPASSVPAATSTTVVSQPAPSGGAAGAQTGACTNEGAWNCIGGSSFQRCASGQWSVPQKLAQGTTCTVGMSNTLGMSRHRFRRGAHRQW